MAPRGRPPTPTEVKKRRGTARGDRVPNLSNLAAVPAVMPEPVELDPVSALDYVLSAGQIWLAQTDTLALAMLREAIEERASLRAVVMATQSAEARKALRDLEKQILAQMSALGFDPSGRSRLGLAEVKSATKLEQLRRARGEN
jgi:hypothetical protein